MTLALGLAATFLGAAFAISGYTNRPIGRLLFGYWDAPGSSATASAPAPGNALTGGVYASGDGGQSVKAFLPDPVGAAQKGAQ